MLHNCALLLPLIVFGNLAVVMCQSEGDGVFVRVYPNGTADGNLTEVSSTGVNIILRCESSTSPTEWVFDNDLVNITPPKFPCAANHWHYRWHSFTGYVNKSFLRLRCDNLESELALGCRSVANHSDNVVVKLQPNQTTARLYISKQRHAWVEHEEPKSENSTACVVRFTVARTRDGNYWKCESADGTRGKLAIGYCSSDCANIQRKLKLVPVCLNYLGNNTHPSIVADQIGWVGMNKERVAKYPAGVAVCELEGGESRGAAVEFFFAGSDKSTIHFSLSEISMNDLIWFDPTPTSASYPIYTKDEIKTRCKVSYYGLAFEPILIVKANGSVALRAESAVSDLGDSTRVQNLTINFDSQGFGPGPYEINCSAMVWNTSEWASQTLKFEVRDVVPPYFEDEHENITATNGATNVRLQCDPHGEPVPNVTWKYGTLLGLHTEGRELVFPTVSARWVNGTTIKCEAVNKYGQGATKTFKMHVTPDKHAIKGDGSISPGTVIAIVLLVLVLLSLGIGLAYLFLRFVRFGRAVAQVLSDEEVKEFQMGSPTPAPATESQEGQPMIDSLPYNPEFEVAKESLHIDFNTVLGSGQFGVVYMGYIKQGPDVGTIQVAVKTVRPNVHLNYFKALMSELKILAHIGHHENIARLMGAYSINIKERELFLGVELCRTSLEKHLRKNAAKFNTVETSIAEGSVGSANFDGPITTLDLIRWSGQIAAGMEYLSDMRVVHADLAARNVLLSFEDRAKICDFGLARQLVNYAYIKKTKCGLPWKWMAIESLRHMHFSTMSDVWSFGVTCWEIFSLGEVPYTCEELDKEFVGRLVAGNRLKKPKLASPEIFNILHQCWYERRERRPLFSELKQFFQELEQQLTRKGGAYVSSDELNLEAESEF